MIDVTRMYNINIIPNISNAVLTFGGIFNFENLDDNVHIILYPSNGGIGTKLKKKSIKLNIAK